MGIRSSFVWIAGLAAATAAISTGRNYYQWKRKQEQRLLTEGRLLTTARGTVEYQVEGEGPTILVLHGSPGGYDNGIALARSLALKGFTVLAPSRPGYRRTPLASGKTPEEQADLFAAFLDTLHIQQATVIAISGGGPAALQFALRHRERCQGLLLISALSQVYSEEGVYRSLPPVQRVLKRTVDQLIVFNPFLYLLTGVINRVPQGSGLSGFVNSLVMNDLRTAGYRNDMRQFAALPAYPLQDIAVPTLIIHGTRDVDIPFDQARQMADAIPGSRLVVVEGAQHFTTMVGDKARAMARSFLLQCMDTNDGRR